MLVLSRKENERIRLGDSIVITIVRVTGDKVRIGIQAPPHVVVLRDELESFATASPSIGAPSGVAAPLNVAPPVALSQSAVA